MPGLGRIGGGPRIIALDGHADVVDVGDLYWSDLGSPERLEAGRRVYRAVQAAGLGDKIKVYGGGLTLMGMEAIYDGTMRFSMLKSQAQMATICVKFLKTAIAGETPASKQDLVQPVVIMKDNVLTVRDPMFGGTVPDPSTWTPPK